MGNLFNSSSLLVDFLITMTICCILPMLFIIIIPMFRQKRREKKHHEKFMEHCYNSWDSPMDRLKTATMCHEYEAIPIFMKECIEELETKRDG